ncbi:MAG: serine/threonine-protein kinase [Planctomycetota bacterium]|nr:serine/threonine-protein kinase [Planctomycetota bacterium]
MTGNNFKDSDDLPIVQDASWLRREMARAADEVPSIDIEQASVHEALGQCTELLSRFWPAEVETAKSSSESVPSLPIGPDVEAGTRLGRFEIRRCLGHGGFGIVFLVFDSRLNREAALKIPRPEVFLSRTLREQFLREAQAVAALDHPGIVPIFEIGEIGPIGYILSAYCQGPTLARWLHDQPRSLPPREAARIVEQLAEAVQHAHTRAILHRDIKPANILLEPQGESFDGSQSFVPRLSDFGLAKRLDASTDSDQPRAILGTPRYMAPEQAAGNESEIGVHSDVYALGVILFELLTLETSNDALTGEPSNLLEAENVWHALRERNVPRDLASICVKCLRYRPADRFGTARELASDLRRFAAGEPVTSRPLRRDQRFVKWCKRRPLVSALSLCLALAIGAGVVVAGGQWYRAERHLAEVKVQAAQAKSNLVHAENAMTDLAWIFEESALWAPGSVTLRDAMHKKLNDYVVQTQHGKADSESPILAAMYSFSARHAGLSGDSSLANRNYSIAMDRWRRLVVKDPDNLNYQRGLSLCLYNFRRSAVEAGRIAGVAEEGLADERDFYRKMRGDGNIGNWSLYEFARVVFEQGNVLRNSGRPKDAMAAYRIGQIALEIFMEPRADDSDSLTLHGQCVTMLAKVKRRLREGTDYENLLSAAQQSFEAASQKSPDNRQARGGLAEVLRLKGLFARDKNDFTAAERSLNDAVAIYEPLSINQHEDFLMQLQFAAAARELAYVKLALGHEKEALSWFGRCRELWRPARNAEALSIEDCKSLAYACRDEGKLAQGLGQSEIAKAAFAEGIVAFRLKSNHGGGSKAGGLKDTLYLADCHFYLGRQLAAAGQAENAATNLRAAIELLSPLVNTADVHRGAKDTYDKSLAKLAEINGKREDISTSGTQAD